MLRIRQLALRNTLGGYSILFKDVLEAERVTGLDETLNGRNQDVVQHVAVAFRHGA